MPATRFVRLFATVALLGPAAASWAQSQASGQAVLRPVAGSPGIMPVVVSITMFHAGTARNVIPFTAEISGTVRTLDKELRNSMEERLTRIIAGICQATRATYTFDYSYGTPVTINDARISDLVREVGREVIGAENVVELAEPTMGAEDFAYYLERIPGAMFRLGTGCPSLLHTPKYDFGDSPLETGILMMVESARRFLTGGGLA